MRRYGGLAICAWGETRVLTLQSSTAWQHCCGSMAITRNRSTARSQYRQYRRPVVPHQSHKQFSRRATSEVSGWIGSSSLQVLPPCQYAFLLSPRLTNTHSGEWGGRVFWTAEKQGGLLWWFIVVRTRRGTTEAVFLRENTRRVSVCNDSLRKIGSIDYPGTPL